MKKAPNLSTEGFGVLKITFALLGENALVAIPARQSQLQLMEFDQPEVGTNHIHVQLGQSRFRFDHRPW